MEGDKGGKEAPTCESKFAREQIDPACFLSKQVIEDIVNITPNETGVVGVSTASGRGVTNLVCLPRKQAEIDSMMKLEEAISKTELQRTLAEAQKYAKSEARAPPRTFYTVKQNLATYSALLYVLFGKKCDLLEKVWHIYGIMRETEVAATREGYSPMLCKEIAWTIYDDSRSYFATRLLPSDFDDLSGAKVPESMLEDI